MTKTVELSRGTSQKVRIDIPRTPTAGSLRLAIWRQGKPSNALEITSGLELIEGPQVVIDVSAAQVEEFVGRYRLLGDIRGTTTVLAEGEFVLNAEEEISSILRERSSSQGDAHLVSGSRQRWRREFNDPTLAEWTYAANGLAAPAVANGNFTQAMGTTAGASFSLTSKAVFSAPFKAAVGFQISQKIANQEFYIEVVASSLAGVDESVVAAWRISGTDSVTATVARTEVRNGGAARVASANLASNQTQTAAGIYEITLESDEVWFHSKAADSAVAKTTSFVRNTISPDPNRQYHLRVRGVNGATAPASATTLTLSFATVVDFTEFSAEVSGGTGSVAPGQAVPVAVANALTVGVSSVQRVDASAAAVAPVPFKVISAATTNPTVVRGAANARLYGYELFNNATTIRYVKVHNLATAPTAGTTPVVMVIPVGPGQSVRQFGTAPMASFSAGLSITIVAGAADNDATAIGAGDVVGSLFTI